LVAERYQALRVKQEPVLLTARYHPPMMVRYHPPTLAAKTPAPAAHAENAVE